MEELHRLAQQNPYWSLEEFAEVANQWLPRCLPEERANTRVREEVNPRLIRQYATLNLVDSPLKEGREARYTYRHLLQLLVTRRLLAEGYATAVIHKLVAGQDDDSLENMLAGGAPTTSQSGPSLNPAIAFLQGLTGRSPKAPAPIDPPSPLRKLSADSSSFSKKKAAPPPPPAPPAPAPARSAAASSPSFDYASAPAPAPFAPVPSESFDPFELAVDVVDFDEEEDDTHTLESAKERRAPGDLAGFELAESAVYAERSESSLSAELPHQALEGAPAPKESLKAFHPPAPRRWVRVEVVAGLELNVLETFQFPTDPDERRALMTLIAEQLEAASQEP